MLSARRLSSPLVRQHVLVFLLIASVRIAHGQDAPAPTPPTPPPPAASLPPSGPPAADPAIEERFRRLEARYQEMDRRHSEEYRALADRYQDLQKRVNPGASPPAPRAPGTAPAATATSSSTGLSAGLTGPNARERSGIDAEGSDGRTYVREAPSSVRNKKPARVLFDEGIEFSSEDDEFKLNFHDLTQAEYRGFPNHDQGTLKDQFFVPRQRWYFTGQATKNVEFYTDINRGYGAIDLLDAFITLNISQSLTNKTAEEVGSGAQGASGRTTVNRARGSDPRLRFRVGRMKTPYLYEYFSIAEGDLIAPERSLYAGNFAGNRQDGAMFLGDVLDDRVGYTLGLFNGPRRSFQDYNSDKDVFFSLNTRPFLHSEELKALKYFNIGGGITGGFENNPTQPNALTTAADQTPNATVNTLSPTFLTFNNNTVERGKRVQYAGHIAWFWDSFMLLAEYGGGDVRVWPLRSPGEHPDPPARLHGPGVLLPDRREADPSS